MQIKEKVTEYAENIIGNSLYDVLKFCILQLVFSGLFGTAATTVTSQHTLSVPLRIAIIIASIALSIILFLVIYWQIMRYKFHILSMDVNYEFLGEKVITTSTITVKALRKNLDGIYHRYTWYDDEKSRIRCLTRGMKIERLPVKDTSYEYRVVFGKRLKRGEKITYITRFIGENKHNHVRPLYGREIISPVSLLSLTVVIPSKYGFKFITESEIQGSAYNSTVKSNTFSFINSHTWKISKPKVGYEYRLTWTKQAPSLGVTISQAR